MNIKNYQITPILELFPYYGKSYILNKIYDKTFNSTFYVGIEMNQPCTYIWEHPFLILNNKKQIQKDNNGNDLFTTLYRAIHIAGNYFIPEIFRIMSDNPFSTKEEEIFLTNPDIKKSGTVQESTITSPDIFTNYLASALTAYDFYDASRWM